MDVLIFLHNQQVPIKAFIEGFNAGEFTNELNGNRLFINLGGNVVSRNLIQMITPAADLAE